MAAPLVRGLTATKSNRDPVARLEIPILGDLGKTVGALRCIDAGIADDSNVVRSLTEWRNRHRTWFLTQFVASPDRTRKWLHDIVVPTHDRILFLIIDKDGGAVGNIGLCNVGPRKAEIDNVLVGEAVATPGIASRALVALLGWTFARIEAPTINLHVFSHNESAIRLYKRTGFVAGHSAQLSYTTEDGTTTFLVDTDEGVRVDFRYLEMSLSKMVFLQRQSAHPSVPPLSS